MSCPNCGYCPHCGRSSQSFQSPMYPQPYITWGGAMGSLSGGVISGGLSSQINTQTIPPNTSIQN